MSVRTVGGVIIASVRCPLSAVSQVTAGAVCGVGKSECRRERKEDIQTTASIIDGPNVRATDVNEGIARLNDN